MITAGDACRFELQANPTTIYYTIITNACMDHGSCGHGHAYIGGGVDGCRERSNKGKHGPHVREYLGASGMAFMQPCMQSFLRAPAPAGLALHRRPSLANAHASRYLVYISVSLTTAGISTVRVISRYIYWQVTRVCVVRTLH